MAITPRTHLPAASDRVGILTLEKARVSVERGAVIASTQDAVLAIPVHTLTALFLGPGTTLTHRAAAELADACVTVVWSGSGAVRAYSSVNPLAVRSGIFHLQVSSWSDRMQRLAVARRLYELRFPDSADADTMTMDQLRAAEGRRVRERYRVVAADNGLVWTRRDTDWDRADDLNRAITTAYQALYGSALAVIQGLGLHPGLGFLHTGKLQAFVYDVADLHKTTMGLDVAVKTYLEHAGNVERAVRAAMNREMSARRVLESMVGQIHALLGAGEVDTAALSADDLELFDLRGDVPARTDYAEPEDAPF